MTPTPATDFGRKRRRQLLERLTSEAEWRRCTRDKPYFYETYCYIPSAEAELGRTLFKLWDFQEETQRVLDESDRLVVCKVRQIGATTQTMADSFHNGFFHRGRYELLVVSKSQEDAKTNLSMIDHIHRFLPEWMKGRGPRRVDSSTEQITFEHRDGSLFRSVSIVGTPKRGAGKTANRVVLDEYALMDKPTQVYRALEPTTLAALNSEFRRGAVFVVLSTPRGRQNAFANLVTGALDGTAPGWTALYHPATCNRFLAGAAAGAAANRVRLAEEAGETPDPADVDLAEVFWEAWRAKQSDPAYKDEPWVFFSEYSRTLTEALRESARAYFQHLPAAHECPPFPFHGWLRMEGGKVIVDLADDEASRADAPWHFRYLPEEWDRNTDIVLAADTASGVGGDDSAAVVLAATTGPDGEDAAEVLAAFWDSTVTPAEFADELRLAGLYFRPADRQAAHLVVEHPPGASAEGEVVARVRQRGYPYAELFRYTPLDRVSARKSKVPGWPTDKATKPEAVRALARLLTARLNPDTNELEPYVLLDGLFPEARDQLVNFVVLNKPGDTGHQKLGADAGSHDDLVMTLAIGAAVLERVRRKKGTPRRAEATGEQSVLRDGAVALFDPNEKLRAAKAAAERRAQEEQVAWQREQARQARRAASQTRRRRARW